MTRGTQAAIAAFAAFGVSVVAGCGARGGLEVSITATASVSGIASLRISVTNQGNTATPTVALPDAPVTISPSSARVINLAFDPSRSGPVTLTVEALDGRGASLAKSDPVTAQLEPGQSTRVPVTLTAPGMVGDMAGGEALAAPDLFAPDLTVPDLATPDLLAPDLLAPDLLAPDLLAPDLLAPDLLAPDLLAPDLLTPDLAAAPDFGVLCSDGQKDGDETDRDCGGSCPKKCLQNQGCVKATDCVDLVCSNGSCQAATCADGAKNGMETDIDCGGAGGCPRCVIGKACAALTDCVGLACAKGVCACGFGQPTHVDIGVSKAPGSLVAGDLNGDGKTDLLVNDFDSNQVTVLLNLGQPPNLLRGTALAVGQFPAAVAIGDVDGDGKLDIASANNAAFTVSVFLNTGLAVFPMRYDYAGVGQYPGGVAIADLNADGHGDVVVTINGQSNVVVMLWSGTNGQGAPLFNATSYNVGTPAPGTQSSPTTTTVVDLDGNRTPDLVVANQNTSQVSVLLNRGNGQFLPQATYSTGANPRMVAVGDLNGDGVVDLVVPNAMDNTFSVLIGTGGGVFMKEVHYPTSGKNPGSVAIADLNGDGTLDLVVNNPNNNSVTLYPNLGNGIFGASAELATGGGPSGIVISDLDGDGKLDLAVANTVANTVSVLLAQQACK